MYIIVIRNVNEISFNWRRETELTIDMKVNMESEQIEFREVGTQNGYVFKNHKFKTQFPNAKWIPHFNLYDQKTSIKVLKIPNEWFGQFGDKTEKLLR